MGGSAKILLVSNSPADAEGLAQMLREVGEGREVQTVTDKEAALRVVEQEKVEVVFSHLRDGPLVSTRFLNEVWKRNSQSNRFMVGDGSVDADAVVHCALGGHQFIREPVDEATLKAALHRADSIKRFVRNERIQVMVSKMRTFPSRPTLYLEVMRELRSQNASPIAVGELVGKDLAISTKLIQVVNSAFYALEQKITDPASAVTFLGLQATASLVLCIEAFNQFDKFK